MNLYAPTGKKLEVERLCKENQELRRRIRELEKSRMS